MGNAGFIPSVAEQSLGASSLFTQVGAQPNTFGIPGVDKYGRLGDNGLTYNNMFLEHLYRSIAERLK